MYPWFWKHFKTSRSPRLSLVQPGYFVQNSEKTFYLVFLESIILAGSKITYPFSNLLDWKAVLSTLCFCGVSVKFRIIVIVTQGRISDSFMCNVPICMLFIVRSASKFVKQIEPKCVKIFYVALISATWETHGHFPKIL